MRLIADREQARLDCGAMAVDLLEVRRDRAGAIEAMAPRDLEAAVAAFRGTPLGALDLPDCAEFQSWCIAERSKALALLLKLRRELRQAAGPADAASPPASTAVPEAAPDRPSIAVLRFANLSSDPEQACTRCQGCPPRRRHAGDAISVAPAAATPGIDTRS